MPAFCHIYGQLSQTGHRFDEELDHLLSLGMTCDTEMPLDQVPRHRESLARLQAAGGLVAPTIYPPDLDPGISDSNWWKLSAKDCERLLLSAKAIFEKQDLGPLEAINTYTPGNGLVEACRRQGVSYILGFCAPIVIEDGGWEIAHYGSPLSPYFISDEDYRKPENPARRPDAVMMASMELRNPLVCLNHWSEGPWCPLNAQAVDRWLEPADQPYPFLQMAEDWIRQGSLDEQPRFFQINLQYFFANRCFDHNRRALEWIARQRDAGRLRPIGLRDWAQRLREKSGFVPQTTMWSGEMPGYHTGHRPGFMPDTLVDENLAHQAVWSAPEILPRRWYDYREIWNYPAFQPDGSAPASRPFGSIRATWELNEKGPGFRRGELRVENPGGEELPPLALWEVLDGCEGPFRFQLPQGWQARLAPHPSGQGGAVILEGPARFSGALSLTVSFSRKTPAPITKRWGHILEARTYFGEEGHYTMIASHTPESFAVTLRRISPEAKSPAQLESLCGNEYWKRELGKEPVELAFDGTRLACWHRVWHVTVDELLIEGVDEVETALKDRMQKTLAGLALKIEVPAPGFQLFGNIRSPERWDRAVGRAAGLREIEKINSWFCRQRPQSGEICLEAHPGIFLPRGSITKVLGHEFDVVRCAEGYGFRELCVDYPQGWDWGVAAWVQWRWLKIRLTGLQGRGEHTLHLHAIDAEGRDLCQRIHLIHPTDPTIPHLCVEPCWEVPKGVDARWSPKALCSIPIPEMCEKWPAIDVWINPVERTKLDDWIAEKGAPGVLSHLWLTRE